MAAVLAGPDSTCPIAACAHLGLQTAPPAGPASWFVSSVHVSRAGFLGPWVSGPGYYRAGLGVSGDRGPRPGRLPHQTQPSPRRDGAGTPTFALPVPGTPLIQELTDTVHCRVAPVFPGCLFLSCKCVAMSSQKHEGAVLSRSLCFVPHPRGQHSQSSSSGRWIKRQHQFPSGAYERWTCGRSQALPPPPDSPGSLPSWPSSHDCLSWMKTDELSPNQRHLLASLVPSPPELGCLCPCLAHPNPDGERTCDSLDQKPPECILSPFHR